MRRINVLDEHIANKIAAGEVIERPASVVKELVENALDAGARRIDVEIKTGGKEYIRVTDDGEGIHADEVPLALERHATSKIMQADDLFGVGTLGFRGEALPSIAAVAEVEVRSRTHAAATGVTFSVRAGQPGVLEPIGMPIGTAVVVRRLFFNTPARYKFLRTDGAERRRIADVVARLALAWPEVAFRFVADARELLVSPGDGDLSSAIGAIYGAAGIRGLIPLDFDRNGVRVAGLVGRPDAVHGNRDRMSVFLNRRWIQSGSLLHAIVRGYETLLSPRRFPLAIVHLRLDPGAVDVNVHPAKSEVRFQDDGAIFRAVMQAVRDALLKANLVGGWDVPSNHDGYHPYPTASPPGAAETATTVETYGDLPKPYSASSFGAAAAVEPAYGTGPRTSSQHSAPDVAALGTAADRDTRVQLREMSVLSQLQRTFILGEVRSGLWIIDQHIAHERVLYEKYLKDGGRANAVQQLLTPVILTLTPDRSGLVEEFSDQLGQLGFDLEPFGGSSYAVRGVPVALARSRDEGSLTALLEGILDACVTEGRWNPHEAAAALSCKAAVKAGDALTKEQMQQLILRLADADNPFACPHGRPIVIEVSRLDLERRFGRR